MKIGITEQKQARCDQTDEATNENYGSRVRFYDRSSLEDMDWPNTEDGRYARAYLEPLMLQGTRGFIINVSTNLLIARIDDLVLPLTVNELSACLIGQARENGHLLHESAGAAQFKRNRGAVSDFEYSAVYERHLPMSRRWCWLLLERLLNRVGVPLMRRMKL
ncbi:hypothetical protein G6L45_33290 [Agrobacterium rhizogenes]|nr:hypothetical protein [Rhizobium rhizogenes]